MDLRSKTARDPVLRALHLHLAQHDAVITMTEAMSLGATLALVDGLVARGEWIREHEGVYRHAAAPRTSRQAARVALAAGGDQAALSHRSAAWWWELLASPPIRPEISIPRGRRARLRHALVHRPVDHPLAVVRHGLRVTSPARTVLDVVGVVRPDVAELVIDRAIARKLVTVTDLAAALDRFGRRGRPGSGRLREALEQRGVSCPTRIPSVLESAMARLCRRFGLPDPVAEYIAFAGAPYRFDFAWPEVKVAVEVDGYESHSSYEAFRRGLARDRWCAEHGWTVLHFTWDDVRNRPEDVAAQIRRVLAARRIA